MRLLSLHIFMFFQMSVCTICFFSVSVDWVPHLYKGLSIFTFVLVKREQRYIVIFVYVQKFLSLICYVIVSLFIDDEKVPSKRFITCVLQHNLIESAMMAGTVLQICSFYTKCLHSKYLICNWCSHQKVIFNTLLPQPLSPTQTQSLLTTICNDNTHKFTKVQIWKCEFFRIFRKISVCFKDCINAIIWFHYTISLSFHYSIYPQTCLILTKTTTAHKQFSQWFENGG